MEDIMAGDDIQVSMSFWYAFQEILESTWWTRVWTLQESILAPRSTVYYGLWSMPFSNLVSAVDNYAQHLGSCCLYIKPWHWLGPQEQLALEKLIKEVYRIRMFHDLSFDTVDPWEETKRYPMWAVLRVLRSRSCWDARDRIYGLLGINRYNQRLSIATDYKSSVAEVYSKAFYQMLQEYPMDRGDLNPLVGSSFNSEVMGLPSWVPDFTAHLPDVAADWDHERAARAYFVYDASIGHQAEPILHQDHSLGLTGVMVDKVTQILSKPNVELLEPGRSYWEETHQRLTNLKVQILNNPNFHPELGPDAREARFWRAVTTEVVWDGGSGTYRRLDSEDLDELQKWLSGVEEDVERFFSPHGFPTILGATMNSRAMFLTAKGDLGVGPQDIRTGDEVWILFGGRVPFVLRPAPENPIVDYHFIGDTYVGGIMWGESLTGNMEATRDIRLV